MYDISIGQLQPHVKLRKGAIHLDAPMAADASGGVSVTRSHFGAYFLY